MDFPVSSQLTVLTSPKGHSNCLKQLCLKIPSVLTDITVSNFPPTEYQLQTCANLERQLKLWRFHYRFFQVRYFSSELAQATHKSSFREIFAFIACLQCYVDLWARKARIIGRILNSPSSGSANSPIHLD